MCLEFYEGKMCFLLSSLRKERVKIRKIELLMISSPCGSAQRRERVKIGEYLQRPITTTMKNVTMRDGLCMCITNIHYVHIDFV